MKHLLKSGFRFKSFLFKFFVFLLVLIFTFILRAHNYEKTPGVGHLDEQLYALSGVSLIKSGVPISWSTLDYPKSREVYRGEINYKGGDPKASVTLYKPWLDEPPLFSYLVGFFANKFGVEERDFVPSTFIRYPMIFISALTSIFVFLIASHISGFWVGMLSMLIYGTVPIFVFASRTAMPETLITLCFSILVYLILLFRKKQSFWYLIPMPILAGVAGLSKPTGFFIILFAIFFVFMDLCRKSSYRKAFIYSFLLLFLTLPFVGFYFWWGYHLDWEVFKRINSIQSSRPVGFGSLAWFFITPSFDTQITRDSWFVFGLLSSAYFLFKGLKGDKFVVLMAFVFWVLVVMVSGGENDLLAWYRFPSYPFLAILIAWGLLLILKKSDFFSMFLAFGLLLGNRMLLVNPFHPNVLPHQYRFWIVFFFFLPILNLLFRKKFIQKTTQLMILVIVILGLFFNVKYIYNSFELACQSKSCPIVESSKISELRIPFFWRFLVMNKAQ